MRADKIRVHDLFDLVQSASLTSLAKCQFPQQRSGWELRIEAFVQRHDQNPEAFRWHKREMKGRRLRNTIITYVTEQ